MFSNDPNKVIYRDTRESNKSPKKKLRDQNDTFNNSNRETFEEESRHQELFYMQNGNTSFDFGFQND